MTINDSQNEIINEFSLLDGDMEMTVFYVMELGQKLPAIKEEDMIEENIVKGCQSKVWMTARMENDKLYFEADSNTAITKGLVSLLVRMFNGQKPEDILNAGLYFMPPDQGGVLWTDRRGRPGEFRPASMWSQCGRIDARQPRR